MKKHVLNLRLASMLSAALAAVLQLIAMLTVYEADTHYFEGTSILPTLATLLALLGAALGTVAACMTPRTSLNSTPFSKNASQAPIAIGFLVPAVILPLSDSTVNKTFAGFVTVFLAVAVIYGILTNVQALAKKIPLLTVLFGFAAVIGCIALNAYYYFDVTLEMNAPIKVCTQMGLLCITLYLTGELRYLLGNPMPRMFLVLSSWVVSIGALSALSVPVAYFVGLTDRADYAAGAVLVFCLLLTVLLRMKNLLQAPDEPQPEASAQTPEDPTV